METKQNILIGNRQVLAYEAQLLLAGPQAKPLDFSRTFPHHHYWIQ